MADEDNVADELLRQQNLAKAVRLRSRRAHWDEIADQCGFESPAAALRAVGDAMASATRRAEMTADQYRDEANLTLEELLREALGMMAADPRPKYDAEGNEIGLEDDRAVRLRAVDEARRLVGDINKLNGVTPPAAEEEQGAGGIRIVIEQRPEVRRADG